MGIDWKIIGSILKIGIPAGIQPVFITLSNIVVQYYINGLGENPVVAFTVYFKAENFIYMLILAFGQVMLAFTRQNIGASNIKRVKKGVIQCNILSMAVTVYLVVLFMVFYGFILGIFSRDTEVNILVMDIIKITFPCYFLYSVMEVTGSAVRGSGKVLSCMNISINFLVNYNNKITNNVIIILRKGINPDGI